MTSPARKVEFYRHSLTEADLAAAAETLGSVILTTGPVAQRFERRFAECIGLAHVVAVSSCTAALHLSLLGLDVGAGDEVIVPAMTFIATAAAVMHAGATPVLVDVEPTTGLIDPPCVAAAVTDKTQAVVPVHLYGTMADMKALRRIADDRGLRLVEDAAHCIEGQRDGVRPGQLADAACYSFYATKNLTCGEGGAVATNNARLVERLRRLRLHGMTADAAERHGGAYRHWDMVELGWKYNLDDIHAALLIGQIDRLAEQWRRREQIAHRYDAAFAEMDGVEVPAVRGTSARHLYTIWVDGDRRDAILAGLQKRGIGVAVNYRAIHTLTFFRQRFGYRPEDFPVANEIGRRTISLPLYPKLTDEEADCVIAAVRDAVAEAAS